MFRFRIVNTNLSPGLQMQIQIEKTRLVYANSGPGLVIKLQARAGKCKLGARTSKCNLEASAGKYKLGTSAGKYELGARVGNYGQGLRPWPGARKYKHPIKTRNAICFLNICLMYKEG